MPNGSPVSPDVLEKSRWSDLSSKPPESGPSNPTKDEDTNSVPVQQTDLPSTLSTGAGPEVPVNDVPSSAAQNPPPVPGLATFQHRTAPRPPIPNHDAHPPFSGSHLRYTRSSPASIPSITSSASAPIPAPSGSSSSEPAANPIAPRFPGYRPPSVQRVDTQYQPYPPPGAYVQQSLTAPQMTSISYPQGAAAPYFSDIRHMHFNTSPQVAATPQGSVTGIRTAKGPSGAFVADDPFRQGNRKVQKLSNNTTFDDIPIDDSPSFRLSFGSASFGFGHESQTPPYQTSRPSSSYQISQPTESYQISQPTGSYQFSQPTGSYQVPQPTGSYPSFQPTGPSQIPQRTGSYQTFQPTGPSQIPQPTGSYQSSQPTGSSQPMGSYQVAQATGPYQPSHTMDPPQTSQPASSYQTSQATDLYHTPPLPPEQEYHTSQPIAPYQSSFLPSQDQQASPSTAPSHTPWLPNGEYQSVNFVPPPQTSVSPINQVQGPLPPSTPQGQTPALSLDQQAPILPPSPTPHTPAVSSLPGQTLAPHVVPPYFHDQYSHPNAGDQMTVPATTHSWEVPWGSHGAIITSPPAQGVGYNNSFSSATLIQQTAPLARPPAITQVAQPQSQIGLHQTIPSPEAVDVWPQYNTGYGYPPETLPPSGLFDVENSSIWSRIGDFFRWPFAWIRGDNESGGASYHSANTFTFVAEGYGKVAGRFVLQTLPRTMYIHLLLRLPSLYFGRVARIFEEADLSLSEIKKMAIETAVQGQFDFQTMEMNMVPPQYERLTTTWQSFINDVLREWQTFNIVSVLLLS